MGKEKTWSDEEEIQWEADLQKRMTEVKCSECGSNKVTHSVRGRPYMPYVDWAKWRSEQLGWTILSLSGCTRSGTDMCVSCEK